MPWSRAPFGIPSASAGALRERHQGRQHRDAAVRILGLAVQANPVEPYVEVLEGALRAPALILGELERVERDPVRHEAPLRVGLLRGLLRLLDVRLLIEPLHLLVVLVGLLDDLLGRRARR